jgi:hypothetical protein
MTPLQFFEHRMAGIQPSPLRCSALAARCWPFDHLSRGTSRTWSSAEYCQTDLYSTVFGSWGGRAETCTGKEESREGANNTAGESKVASSTREDSKVAHSTRKAANSIWAGCKFGGYDAVGANVWAERKMGGSMGGVNVWVGSKMGGSKRGGDTRAHRLSGR